MKKITKILSVLSVLSIVLLLLVAIVMMILTENGNVPNWYEKWSSFTIASFYLSLIMSGIVNYKHIKQFFKE